LRGYYPGEREEGERSQPGIRKPRIPERRDPDLSLPKPRLRRAHTAAAAAGATQAAGAKQRAGRRVDWVLGILLGIVLGIAVVVAFLLFGSEGTIDAPSIHGVNTGKPPVHARPAPQARE
jgi:hypothetical protein